MSELKPCPFCGGEAVETKFYTSSEPNNYKYSKQRAKCSNEACILGDAFELDVEAWNSRPIEDEQAKLIENAGEQLAFIQKERLIPVNGLAGIILEQIVTECQDWKDKQRE